MDNHIAGVDLDKLASEIEALKVDLRFHDEFRRGYRAAAHDAAELARAALTQQAAPEAPATGDLIRMRAEVSKDGGKTWTTVSRGAVTAPEAPAKPYCMLMHSDGTTTDWSHLMEGNTAAQQAGAAVEMMTLLQDAARAWNNETESELDATMERIESFLIESRATPAATTASASEQSKDKDRLLTLATEEYNDAGASVQHGADKVDVPEWARLVVRLFANTNCRATAVPEKLAEWAALTEEMDTDWFKGYEAARAYVRMQLALVRPSLPAEEDEQQVAWMIWLHGPAGVFENKDDARLELERRNRLLPNSAKDRRLIELRAQAPSIRKDGLPSRDADGSLINEGTIAQQGAPHAANAGEDTERLDYIDRKAVRGASYHGITSVNVIVYEDDLAMGGVRYAIDCMREREQGAAIAASAEQEKK
jgi:hypothetical protein